RPARHPGLPAHRRDLDRDALRRPADRAAGPPRLRADGCSSREARWLALAGQGLGPARPSGPVTRRHLRAAIGTLDVLQLAAIHVLARTQFLVPFSRIGAYDPELLHRMGGPGGELFESWGPA